MWRRLNGRLVQSGDRFYGVRDIFSKLKNELFLRQHP